MGERAEARPRGDGEGRQVGIEVGGGFGVGQAIRQPGNCGDGRGGAARRRATPGEEEGVEGRREADE